MSNKPAKYKIVRPDSKGRVTLGRIAEGVSSYILSRDKHNRIVLDPQVEIPAQEKWLFENKSALDQVKQGIQESSAGRLNDMGSFANFIEDDE